MLLERLGFLALSQMAAVMETDLKAILESNGVTEPVIFWMTQNGCSTTRQFANGWKLNMPWMTRF